MQTTQQRAQGLSQPGHPPGALSQQLEPPVLPVLHSHPQQERGAGRPRGRFTPWRQLGEGVWCEHTQGVADMSVTQVPVPPHG